MSITFPISHPTRENAPTPERAVWADTYTPQVRQSIEEIERYLYADVTSFRAKPTSPSFSLSDRSPPSTVVDPKSLLTAPSSVSSDGAMYCTLPSSKIGIEGTALGGPSYGDGPSRNTLHDRDFSSLSEAHMNASYPPSTSITQKKQASFGYTRSANNTVPLLDMPPERMGSKASHSPVIPRMNYSASYEDVSSENSHVWSSSASIGGGEQTLEMEKNRPLAEFHPSLLHPASANPFVHPTRPLNAQKVKKKKKTQVQSQDSGIDQAHNTIINNPSQARWITRDPPQQVEKRANGIQPIDTLATNCDRAMAEGPKTLVPTSKDDALGTFETRQGMYPSLPSKTLSWSNPHNHAQRTDVTDVTDSTSASPNGANRDLLDVVSFLRMRYGEAAREARMAHTLMDLSEADITALVDSFWKELVLLHRRNHFKVSGAEDLETTPPWREHQQEESLPSSGPSSSMSRFQPERSLQARRATSSHNFTPDRQLFLRRGEVFLKFGRNGSPAMRFVCLQDFNGTPCLMWTTNARSSPHGQLPVNSLRRIDRGADSPIFQRHIDPLTRRPRGLKGGLPVDVRCCFSLYFDVRSLDLCATGTSPQHAISVAEQWVDALVALLTSLLPSQRASSF